MTEKIGSSLVLKTVFGATLIILSMMAFSAYNTPVILAITVGLLALKDGTIMCFDALLELLRTGK